MAGRTYEIEGCKDCPFAVTDTYGIGQYGDPPFCAELGFTDSLDLPPVPVLELIELRDENNIVRDLVPRDRAWCPLRNGPITIKLKGKG